MATIEMSQLMAALEKADAAGNTEDAKRIATIINDAMNPKDDSLLTGMANSALRIGKGLVDLPQTLVEAATGIEDPSLLVGNNKKGFQLSDLTTMPRFVSNEEAEKEGYTENPFGFSGDEFAKASKFIQEKQNELNYTPKVPWDTVKENPTAENILAFMGEGAITSLPDMGAALISAPSYFLSYIAPIAQKRAENDGGRPVNPSDIAFASVASAGIATAERLGAKGIFGKSAGNAVTRPLKAGAKEATTEAIQNPLQYAGESVRTEAGFDTTEAADQTLQGLVGGAGAGTGLRAGADTVKGTVNLAKKAVPDSATPQDGDAAADFARDLNTVVEADGFDLNDVDPSSTDGARGAIDSVHVNYTEQMKTLIDSLKKQLNLSDTDAEAVRMDKTYANAAFRKGRNKTKNTVGSQDMKAVEDLVGNTAEGQQLLALLRKTNELTRVHNAGLKGGVSRVTDVLNPFENNSGYSNSRNIVAPLIGAGTAGAAVGTGGLSAIPQVAAVLGGRGIDAMTGRRSRVAKFIRDNQRNQGIDSPKRPSVIAGNIALAEQKQKQDLANRTNREQENRRLNQANAQPTPNSPQDTMQKATGLDKRGVADIINIIERQTANPAVTRAIKEYRISIDTGGAVSNDMLSPLIRAVNQLVDSDQRLSDKRVAEPVRQQAEDVTSEVDQRVRKGIEENRKVIERLRKEVNDNNSIALSDKAILQNALTDLSSNLGQRPVQAALEIVTNAEQSLRKPELAEKHLLPYVERVARQQKDKQRDQSA